MKRAFLTLISMIFMISLFGQSFIGMSKKVILEDFKEDIIKIEKSEKENDGSYSLTIKFQNSTNIYSFTSDDLCYFYIIAEKYYADNYMNCVKYYDERYLRAFDDPCSATKKFDIWKEPKGKTFVYRWIVCNYNQGVQYTLVLTKENYENNKNSYLQGLLSSNQY